MHISRFIQRKRGDRDRSFKPWGKRSCFCGEESESGGLHPNVEVQSFDGLLVDFMRQNHAKVIVRGLRAITDFEYELQLAQMNRVIAPEIDTLFLTTNLKYAYLSSSMAKEVAMYGGDISEFLDPVIAKQVQEKYQALQEDRECK